MRTVSRLSDSLEDGANFECHDLFGHEDGDRIASPRDWQSAAAHAFLS